MTRCIVCDSPNFFRKKYDRHVRSFSLKKSAKALVSRVAMTLRVRQSIKSSTVERNLFSGTVRVCEDCGHGLMDTPPSHQTLLDYYETRYWAESGRDAPAACRCDFAADPRAQHQTAFILQCIEPNRISKMLEIGAGPAHASLLLRAKSEQGALDIAVCEPGFVWDRYYKSYGIRKVADFFPWETQERFDFVHTSHWLEHVLNLDHTLSALSEAIPNGGNVFVEVPNTEHYYWRLPERDRPHIHFFTRTSLAKAFRNRGFSCVRIGEFGITYAQRNMGIQVTDDNYGECEKGFWIRALFEKVC